MKKQSIKKFLKFTFIICGAYYAMQFVVDLFDGPIGDFLHFISGTQYIDYLSKHHKIIKEIMFITAFLPSLQMIKLLKTKHARDVSWMYQLFTIISIIALSSDIFRSQYKFNTVNYFNIMCGYLKIALYNINLFLIFHYKKNLSKQSLRLGCLFLFEIFILSGMLFWKDGMYWFLNIGIVQKIILFILVTGMVKPAFQIYETYKKKSAKDVSLLYYIVFIVYLTCSIHDNIIVAHIKDTSLPIRNVTVNMIKFVFYMITLGVILSYRIKANQKKKLHNV